MCRATALPNTVARTSASDARMRAPAPGIVATITRAVASMVRASETVFPSSPWPARTTGKANREEGLKEAGAAVPLTLSTAAKQEITHLAYHPGGGAANAAVSFAQQGFAPSICALIGNDAAGAYVRENLQNNGVDTTALLTHEQAATGTSIILQTPHGESAITAHRGANRALCASMLPMAFVTSHSHLYITSLSGPAAALLPQLVAGARASSQLIACNPGTSQLKKEGITHLLSALPNIDVLLLNHAEAKVYAASMDLTDESEYTFAHAVIAHGPDIVGVTHGAQGVHIYTKERHYHAPRIPVKVVDTVGAGDAFGSTFVGSLIRGTSIQEAIDAGLHASATVIGRVGAQNYNE